MSIYDFYSLIDKQALSVLLASLLTIHIYTKQVQLIVRWGYQVSWQQSLIYTPILVGLYYAFSGILK